MLWDRGFHDGLLVELADPSEDGQAGSLISLITSASTRKEKCQRGWRGIL